MSVFSTLFTWWNGATLGTRLFTSRHGREIGTDSAGNRYFEQKAGVGPLGRPRRWVIYPGIAEASSVPAEWHGWLHYTVEEPPSASYQAKSWQRGHRPNMTGTPAAYRPPGSVLNPQPRRVAADYEPWRAD